jgi:hypothetical protein
MSMRTISIQTIEPSQKCAGTTFLEVPNLRDDCGRVGYGYGARRVPLPQALKLLVLAFTAGFILEALRNLC